MVLQTWFVVQLHRWKKIFFLRSIISIVIFRVITAHTIVTIVYTIISQKFLDYLRTCVILWKDDLSQLDLSRVSEFDSKIRFHPYAKLIITILYFSRWSEQNEKIRIEIFSYPTSSLFLSFNRNNWKEALVKIVGIILFLQSSFIDRERD